MGHSTSAVTLDICLGAGSAANLYFRNEFLPPGPWSPIIFPLGNTLMHVLGGHTRWVQSHGMLSPTLTHRKRAGALPKAAHEC